MNFIDWLRTGLDIGRWDVASASAFAVLLIVFAILTPRFSRSNGEHFARQHRAYVDAAFVRQFDRALVRELRHRQLTLGVPLVLCALVFTDDSSVPQALAPGIVALALCADGALRVRRTGREFERPPAPSRVARFRAVGVRDFVGTAVVVYWLGIAVVATALVVGLSVIAARDGIDALLLARMLTGLAFALLVVTLPVVWRLMVSRPEQSSDAAHLYLQDAWRANLLRDTTSTAHLPAIFVLVTLDSTNFPDASFLAAMMGFLVAAICGVFLIDTNLHFRKRLWPTLIPGQVLMPGDPVPAGWSS